MNLNNIFKNNTILRNLVAFENIAKNHVSYIIPILEKKFCFIIDPI